MGWWFGRKSAPPDARPFVPAWLTSVGEEEGFARSVEGMNVYVKADDCWANYRLGAWEIAWSGDRAWSSMANRWLGSD